ncbi:MAG: hypothetical protein ACLFM7_06425 [Bacteroidales bacterium]
MYNKNDMNQKPDLPFERDKDKETLKSEIARSLTPEERLRKLTQMMEFNKKFSPNYKKAVEKRLREGKG